MFGGDNNFVGNQVGRVESHTELANHRNISTSLEGLHEGLCAGLGDGSQVVDQVSLGHADTGVLDGQGLGLPVGGDLDEEFLCRLQFGSIGKGLITDFIQSICNCEVNSL